MDTSTTLLLLVAALLGINNLIFHLPNWDQRRGLFWFLQLLNLAVIVALLTVGIPGFAGATKAVNWVLALLLILHIVGNNARLLKATNARSDGTSEADLAKRDQLKSALQRGAEE